MVGGFVRGGSDGWRGEGRGVFGLHPKLAQFSLGVEQRDAEAQGAGSAACVFGGGGGGRSLMTHTLCVGEFHGRRVPRPLRSVCVQSVKYDITPTPLTHPPSHTPLSQHWCPCICTGLTPIVVCGRNKQVTNYTLRHLPGPTPTYITGPTPAYITGPTPSNLIGPTLCYLTGPTPSYLTGSTHPVDSHTHSTSSLVREGSVGEGGGVGTTSSQWYTNTNWEG